MDNRDETTEKNFPFLKKERDFLPSVMHPNKYSTSTPTSTPTSSEKVTDLIHTNNPLIEQLIKVIGNGNLSIKEMLIGVELSDRKNFIEYHLNPAIKEKFIRPLYPDKPHHPRQKYLLTVKGLALYQELTKEE